MSNTESNLDAFTTIYPLSRPVFPLRVTEELVPISLGEMSYTLKRLLIHHGATQVKQPQHTQSHLRAI